MRQKLQRAGLQRALEIDSAGTHGYHVGASPDARSQAAALQRGYEFADLRARAVQPEDFAAFDELLVMDEENVRDLRPICPDPGLFSRVRFLLEYAKNSSVRAVPDPYYGGAHGFELVLDLIEDACDGLIGELRGGRAGSA